jgi:hypothetical protein
MLKDLIKLANRLDSKGLTKEADYLDAIIRKLAADPNPDITRALERNRSEDPLFRKFDPSWMPSDQVGMGFDTKKDNEHNRLFYPENFPPERYTTPPSSMSAKPDAVQSVSDYLDVENLPDTRDKKAFFSFLLDYINKAKELVNPEAPYLFHLGPQPIPTRAEVTKKVLNDTSFEGRSFKKLFDKYCDPTVPEEERYKEPHISNNPIIKAFWRYIEMANSILSDPNYYKDLELEQDFRDLRNKIVSLS